MRSLGLKSTDEWRNYCKSGEKPDDIPSNPNRVYADKAWLSMGDFLGTNNISSHIKYSPPFKEKSVDDDSELGFEIEV